MITLICGHFKMLSAQSANKVDYSKYETLVLQNVFISLQELRTKTKQEVESGLNKIEAEVKGLYSEPSL